MSDSVNERGSITSDGTETDTTTDESEFDDPRLVFFLEYLTIAYGTTTSAFKKGDLTLLFSLASTTNVSLQLS